jgi:hypothetical protein
MENSERTYPKDRRLQLVAIVYCAVMLAAFVVGLYGCFSLFLLARAEVERSVHLSGLIW